MIRKENQNKWGYLTMKNENLHISEIFLDICFCSPTHRLTLYKFWELSVNPFNFSFSFHAT